MMFFAIYYQTLLSVSARIKRKIPQGCRNGGLVWFYWVHDTVETMYTSSQIIDKKQTETMYTSSLQMRWKNDCVNERMQSISHHRGLLSTAVGCFKRAVTCFANQNHIVFSWQPRFHDHIIRQTDEMNRIAEYIETNVLRWESDEFYS